VAKSAVEPLPGHPVAILLKCLMEHWVVYGSEAPCKLQRITTNQMLFFSQANISLLTDKKFKDWCQKFHFSFCPMAPIFPAHTQAQRKYIEN
jgi:hypothetical protein